MMPQSRPGDMFGFSPPHKCSLNEQRAFRNQMMSHQPHQMSLQPAIDTSLPVVSPQIPQDPNVPLGFPTFSSSLLTSGHIFLILRQCRSRGLLKQLCGQRRAQWSAPARNCNNPARPCFEQARPNWGNVAAASVGLPGVNLGLTLFKE